MATRLQFCADIYTAAECGAALQQYGIAVGDAMDWGSAPGKVQRAWAASGCTWRICQFFLDEKPTGLGLVPGLDWGDFRPDLPVTLLALPVSVMCPRGIR
jgi:hypothetical protein